MKKNVSKRVLSAFLALVMVFLLIPFSVVSVAAEEQNDSSVPSTGHKLLSSYNVLSGTDISELGSVKSALDIFDRQRFDELILDCATVVPGGDQFGEERRGSTMASYINSASLDMSYSSGVGVGIDKLLKISAENKFNLSGDVSYSEALETYFYEYAITVQKGYYNFNQAHLERIRDFSNGYLSQTFIDDLTGVSGLSAAEFFETYGTHIITSYTGGGVAGVYSSTIKTASSKDVSVEGMYSESIGSNATIDGVQLGGNKALEIQTTIKGKSDTNDMYTKSDIYAHGGDKAVCFVNDTFNYADWANSISEPKDEAVLNDEHLKMVPIWNLMPVTGNEDRMLELMSYFMDMSEQQDLEFCEHFGLDFSKNWLNFEDCQIIIDEEGLYNIRNDLNGVYVLANNITLSKYADWKPIGTKEAPFKGRLYGNYNTISGLAISENFSEDSYGNVLVGLFGCNDGLITDLRISGSISVPEMHENVYVGAIAGYNDGVINNCFDDVLYDIDYSAIEHFNFPIQSENVENNKPYTIRNDELGIHLVGQLGTTYSNVNIVVEEGDNVGPVYIILENVNMTGNANISNGAIYNPTSRPVYLISLGTANTIRGGDGADSTSTDEHGTAAHAIHIPNADLHIFGTAELNIFGGNGWPGGNAEGKGEKGKLGKHGGTGIVANNVYATIQKLNVTGGNGGSGGRGGNNDWFGGNAGDGRNGGNGGMAISCSALTFMETESVMLTGGNGGYGGDGGVTSTLGSIDGLGGNGGNGGLAVSANADVNISSGKAVLIGGRGAHGGSGRGNGGSGGSHASPRAEMYVENKHYSMYENGKTWADAKSYAESLGGYLVTITDAGEHAVINELLKYRTWADFYIGAYRAVDDQNVWAWVTGEPFDYAVWNSGEPNNNAGNEDYLGILMDNGGNFNDYSEDKMLGYIIEFDLTFEEKDFMTGIVTGRSAQEKIRNYNASVWRDNLLQINPSSEPSIEKFSYYSGDKFDASSVEICMYGKPVNYTQTFDSTCRESALSRMGEVKIAKDGYVRYIPVHITKTIPESMEIVKIGKTEFVVEEPFDISGLSVKVLYNNGSIRYITEQDVTYTVPSTAYADQTEEVTITYQESGINLSATYKITTVKDIVETIFIQTHAIKRTYKQGEDLLLDGLQVYESRKSGKKELLDNQYLIFDVSPSLCNIGTSTVTIKHPGNSEIVTTYTIEVEANKSFDHTWNKGEVTLDPTHTTTGIQTYYCTVENCDAIKTEAVPKLEGHLYGDWYRLDDQQHQRMCVCGDTITLDHNWDAGTVTDNPTYTTPGIMTYTCGVCEATNTEEIPVLKIPEDFPFIAVDNKNAVIGSTVTVKLILKNNPGVTSVRINVAYDNTLLTLTGVEYNATMGGQGVLPENMEALDGNIILYWADGFANYEGNDVFATLTFAVSDNAVAGASTMVSVTYDAEDIYDADEENVTFFCDDGVITFIDYTPGDINGDGVLNSKDTTRLMRYHAGWDIEVNEAALDVNGDGDINTRDTTHLMKYLAGWNVEIY